MNIVQRFKNLFTKVFTGLNLTNQMFGFSNPSILSDNVNDFIQDGYRRNVHVYSAINKIIRSISKVPWSVHKIVDEKALYDYKNYQKSTNHPKALMYKTKALHPDPGNPLNKLIHRPNPFQSWPDFIEENLGNKYITGSSYTLAQSPENGLNAGQPQQLTVLPSQFMIITPDQSLCPESYTLRLDRDTHFKIEEIMQRRFWNPDFSLDGRHLYGQAPWQAARMAITHSNDLFTSLVRYMQNTGIIGILFGKGDKTLTEPQAQELERKYRSKYGSVNSKGKIMIASQEMGWLQMGHAFDQMGFNDSWSMSVKDICNVLGIGAELLNDDKSKTFANRLDARKDMVINVAVPELLSLRDDLNNWLAPMFGDNVFLDVDLSVLPELQQDMAELNKQLESAWWLLGNEKRIAQGWLPDPASPEMGVYWIPAGLIPSTGTFHETDPERDE